MDLGTPVSGVTHIITATVATVVKYSITTTPNWLNVNKIGLIN
jgi:hypothetical protein